MADDPEVRNEVDTLESIVFRAEDRQISGSLFVPEIPSPVESSGKLPGLLFVHGFRSDQRNYQVRAETAAHKLRTVGLTFDLSGHGTSGSAIDLQSLTPRHHVADVTAAYDTLILNPLVDGSRIGVCAASYGAYLAVLLTRHRAVSRLLLRAPAMREDDQYGAPLGGVVFGHADPSSSSRLTESLKTFEGEVLILESAADEVIPHSVIQAYLGASPKAQHVIIPEATHALTKPEQKERFLREILTFFGAL
jgi:uncharacterized protein